MDYKNIDYWNYRVLIKIIAEEEKYGVHKVYYDVKGSIVTCSEKPMIIVGDDISEALITVNLMLRAFDKPTLYYNDIGAGEDGG